MTTISVRVDEDTAKIFDAVCEDLKIKKSDFLRACIEKLVDPDKDARERFLILLGFEKKGWVL